MCLHIQCIWMVLYTCYALCGRLCNIFAYTVTRINLRECLCVRLNLQSIKLARYNSNEKRSQIKSTTHKADTPNKPSTRPIFGGRLYLVERRGNGDDDDDDEGTYLKKKNGGASMLCVIYAQNGSFRNGPTDGREQVRACVGWGGGEGVSVIVACMHHAPRFRGTPRPFRDRVSQMSVSVCDAARIRASSTHSMFGGSTCTRAL